MAEIRVYIDVNSGTLNPTEPQWVSFFQQARTKPLAAAILAAAVASQNFIAASKRSQGTGQVLKHSLVAFEVASNQVAGINTVLQAQATSRGVTGTTQQKFLGVLLTELQESAVDLGLTALQSQQITMTIVGYGDMPTAIAAVQAYLVTNDATWHAPAA